MDTTVGVSFTSSTPNPHPPFGLAAETKYGFKCKEYLSLVTLDPQWRCVPSGAEPTEYAVVDATSVRMGPT